MKQKILLLSGMAILAGACQYSTHTPQCTTAYVQSISHDELRESHEAGFTNLPVTLYDLVTANNQELTLAEIYSYERFSFRPYAGTSLKLCAYAPPGWLESRDKEEKLTPTYGLWRTYKLTIEPIDRNYEK